MRGVPICKASFFLKEKGGGWVGFFEREGGGWVGFFGNEHELPIYILPHNKNHVNGYYSEKVVVYAGRKRIACKCLHTKLDVLAYKLTMF